MTLQANHSCYEVLLSTSVTDYGDSSLLDRVYTLVDSWRCCVTGRNVALQDACPRLSTICKRNMKNVRGLTLYP